MGISRTQLIQKVRRRLGEPLVKVELCDSQIIEHIDYARQKYIKWAVGNATQEVYFTILLQAGKALYDLPAGVVDVIAYEDSPIRSGGINTLFTMDNFMFSQGMFGNVFWGGYDLISYHLVLDFMSTLKRYRTTPYNFKYHRQTNQLEVNPIPTFSGKYKTAVYLNPETGLPQEYLVDSPGWLLLRTYMIQGATLPNYVPDWTDVLKEKRTIVEQRKLTTDEVGNKYLLLDHTPYYDEVDEHHDTNVPNDIHITVEKMSPARSTITAVQTVDFDTHYANPRVIMWEGLGLDGQVAINDVVTITYPVVYESNYYPDEWTDVTDSSLEVEQVQVTQQILDRKFVTLRKPVWDNNVKFTLINTDMRLTTDFYVDPRNRRVVRWNGDLVGSEVGANIQLDDIITVEYSTIVNKKPRNATSAPQTLIKSYAPKVYNATLTADDVNNMSVVLPETISAYDGVRLSVGGFTKLYNIDFTVLGDSQTISWDGYALEGNVSIGDNVVVTYSSATPIITEVEEDIYDNDWIFDYVTALSKISLGTIRRKFASFNSIGNKGISLDGSELIQEGITWKDQLEETLRNEEAHEGYGIEVGMM